MHKCATLTDIPDLKNLFGKKWSKERTILEMNKDKKKAGQSQTMENHGLLNGLD